MRPRYPLVLLLGMLVPGCGNEGIAPPVPVAIAVTPDHWTISQGGSVQLTASVLDAEGHPIPDRRVTFSSADTSVVVVDSSGLVRSVRLTGVTPVYARYDRLESRVPIRVTQRIVSLRVQPESLVLNRRLGGRVSASLKDFAGADVPVSGRVLFESPDTSLVKVSPIGIVEAGDTDTLVRIRASVDSLVTFFQVRVTQQSRSIQLDTPNLVLLRGDTARIRATVLDLASLPIAGARFRYTAPAGGLVSVSPTGLVTSLVDSGIGRIRVESDTVGVDVPVFIGATHPVAVTDRLPIPDFGRAAVIGHNGSVIVSTFSAQVYAGAGGRPVLAPIPGVDFGFALAVDHAGTTAYLSGGGIVVVDLATNSVTRRIAAPSVAQAMVVSADDQTLYAAVGQTIYVVDLVRDAVVDSIPGVPATFLALHPTLPILYAGANVVREIDLTTRTITRTLVGANLTTGLGVSPDGSRLYVADQSSANVPSGVRVFSLPDGALLRSLPMTISSLTVSEHYLLVSSFNGVSVLDRLTEQLLAQVVGGSRLTAISPDEKIIVSLGSGRWVDFIR